MNMEKSYSDLIVEIKISVNRRLFEQGCITEEMYHKAKEIIIQQSEYRLSGLRN